MALGAVPANWSVKVAGPHCEVATARLATERARRIYLIELTSRSALDCSTDRVFRHLNHSCRPNARKRRMIAVGGEHP